MSITLRRISMVVAVILLVGATSGATVRCVALDGSGTDGQNWATAYKTIEVALAAPSTVAGDEIWVKQGTYGTGSTIHVTKAVKIHGGYTGTFSNSIADPTLTVITGLNTATHCFDISANAEIHGFTITKGRANGMSPSDEGGGMYIHDCSARVDECRFTSNVAMYVGGAICLDNAAGAVISNCTFAANKSSEAGGAVVCRHSDATIDNCEFDNNVTNNGATDAFGGAIYIDTGAPTIIGCNFTTNSAQYGAGICNYMANTHVEACTFVDCNSATVGGGGVYNFGGMPVISNCLFSDNDVTHRGGAVFDKSRGTIANCVMWNNSSMTYGGAVHIDPSAEGAESAAMFINCTMYGNSAYQGGGLYSDNASATLVNCILWGNVGWDEEYPPEIYNSTWVLNRKTAASYCDIAGDTTYPGTGNLRVDPRFVSGNGGDFRLEGNSPCIDHGTNSAPGLPSADYAGATRIRDGNADGLAVVDMGVYEVQGFSLTDHIHRGEILMSHVYTGAADTSPDYVFMIAFETDGAIDHIDFRTPAGQTFTIPQVDHTSSDGTETFHVVNNDGSHIWQYRATYSSAAGLANYGDGSYFITYYPATGPAWDTVVSYSRSDGPIPQPSQKPNVTSPAYGAASSSPVTLTWDACTDASAYLALVTIIDADSDETVAADTFELPATASRPYDVADGTFDVEVSFAHLYSTGDDNGVPFELGKAVTVLHRFDVSLAAVYRFWSPVLSVHFYTVNVAERDALRATSPDVWTYEGPVFHTPGAATEPGLKPVYRFWTGHSHFYTISEAEKDYHVINFSHVWLFEGPVFYAFPEGAQPVGTKPVYRFWNSTGSSHFYTISEAEKDYHIINYSHVWLFEGVAFYVYE